MPRRNWSRSHVVLCAGTLSVEGFQGVGSTLPIVFVLVIDPVGVGLVDNLAKPGGNVTGFMTYEYPQADCAECDAGGRASRCRYSLRQAQFAAIQAVALRR